MTWIIPDFHASSGGHINILRMMRLLKERGFPNQHVVVMEPHRWSSIEEAQASLNHSFGDYGITVSLGIRSIEPCHYLVATGWQTAYWVAKYRDAIHRLYFVQDFEPAFYAHGSEYNFAENTYKLGMTGITAGSWLAEKLNKEYGMTTFPYSFACDLDLYKPHKKRPNSKKHILFYARPVTPRRCFEMGLLALTRVCERDPDVAVIFAGWDVSGFEIPFHHLNAGTVPVEHLPDLYSQCDVALILSSTNLSLLPLEVAACGCPVVINKGPQSSWLLSEEEAAYCDMSVEGIVGALTDVLENPEKAASLVEAGLARAGASAWSREADRLAAFLPTISVNKHVNDEDEQMLDTRESVER
ncbi:glycosyltransferase family 4 protein [Chelativorans alearense]|uniref:glycosyltransferase family 4 protein n=1 Tax=Chelativorans alearense TaxID=2681495 RepID=UPI0013D3F392|nr:glycosyltransferase family 4 protein [Chelativorans alearense]